MFRNFLIVFWKTRGGGQGQFINFMKKTFWFWFPKFYFKADELNYIFKKLKHFHFKCLLKIPAKAKLHYNIGCICLLFNTAVQMSPQMACLRGCIVTSVAFVRLISSPLCVFKCCLKTYAWEDAKSHWLHLFDFSPLCLIKCDLSALRSEQT